MFVEYENYPEFPESHVKSTGRIFGYLIKKNIVDGVFLRVTLEFISDSLTKTGKLNHLGTLALEEFKDSVHENSEACKNLFAIEYMRTSHAKTLYQIYKNMKEFGDSYKLLPDQHVTEVLKNAGV